MDKLRWGIMGCAGIAEEALIPAVMESNKSSLYAVASRSGQKAKKLALKYGIDKAYASYDELLHDHKINAVYIPLPNSLHKKWVIKAAAAGKNILCEKPLALNLKEVEEMIKAAEENNVLLMEAFMYRFHPQTLEVKDLIDSGVIGEIKHIEAHFTANMDLPKDNYRFSQEMGGGALYDLGCYTVNAVRYFSGCEVEYVYNSLKSRQGSDVDNSGNGVLELTDGILGSIHYSFETFSNQEIIISGSKGKINIPNSFIEKNDLDSIFYLENEKGIETFKVENIDPYKVEVEVFAEAVMEGKNKFFLRADIDAVNNIKVIDALFKSAESGEKVKV